MQFHRKWGFFGLLIVFVLMPASLWAASYYVSPGGDDNNPGTAALPWKTIQKAAATVIAGDTVIIQDGTYTGGIVLDTNPGTKEAPIIFRAEGTGAVIDGNGTYWRGYGIFVDGYGFNEPYWLGFDMYIQIIGLTIRNCDVAGVRISCAHHVTVKDCTMQDNGVWGIFTDFSNYTLPSWKTMNAPGPRSSMASM